MGLSIVDIAAGEAKLKNTSLLKKIETAQTCIKTAYEISNNIFSSYSVGKDSSVQTHLCLVVNPTAQVRIMTDWTSRLMYPEIDSIFQWWRVRFPHVDFREIYTPPLLTHQTFREYGIYRNEKGRPALFNGADGNFVGLRSEESGYRKGALRLRIEGYERFPIYKYRDNRDDGKAGLYRVSPLQYWSTDDVAAYIQKYQIPVLSDYYEDEKFEARTAVCLSSSRDWVLARQVAELKRRHPQNHNVLIGRFPELAEHT